MTGTRLGGWLLGGELGRGHLGTTFRATSTADPSRRAAVKVLTHPAATAPDFLARFPGEMLALRRLTHPNIAAHFDSGVQSGLAYYASELVDGIDVVARLKAKPKGDEPGLGWREAVLSLAAQAARALRHAHHRSILHRDLKPSNLIVTADGTLKITDFGVGKVLSISPLTLPPDPLGSAGFLAPEHFTGKQLSRRSDLYALGGVLYFLLTGRPPHTAATTAEFLHKHCYVLPDRPIQFVPKLPPEFDDLICELLSKDPGRRPASASAVLDDLHAIRGKAERKGERVTWPPEVGTETMPALTETPNAPTPSESGTWERPVPLLSRPTVVLPLFATFLAVVAVVWFWPRPSADELIAGARPLLKSADPDDWDAAEDQYLTPLANRYPDQHTEEVRAARQRIRDMKRLKKAVADGKQAAYGSEAERRYVRGLALAQAGDTDGAKEEWTAVRAFAGVEAAARWVALADAALAEIGGR